MSQGVRITESFAQRIASTVRRVDAMPISSGDGKIPVRFEEGPQAAQPAALRLCKTSSAFNKGTTATLNVWESGTPPSETQTSGETIEGVVNKLFDIPADKWVLVGRALNGAWYVVSAETSPSSIQVITGVTLGESGLSFTTKTISVASETLGSPINIETTECPTS